MGKRCTSCNQIKDAKQFTTGHARCKKCRRLAEAERTALRKRREWVRLVGWPALALVLVTGIYSHDTVNGQWRYCYYESTHGTHVITINAIYECAMSVEIEVDD